MEKLNKTLTFCLKKFSIALQAWNNLVLFLTSKCIEQKHKNNFQKINISVYKHFKHLKFQYERNYVRFQPFERGSIKNNHLFGKKQLVIFFQFFGVHNNWITKLMFPFKFKIPHFTQ